MSNESLYHTEYDQHRPWEQEASFNDVLAEQIKKAPYLIGSMLLHGIIFMAVSAIMLLTDSESSAPEIQMVAAPPPPDVEDEEPPPPEEIIEEVIEEPVIQESELEETVEQESLEEMGDPDFNSDAAFDSDSWNNDVGLGGGAGGKYGGRGGRGGGRRGGNATEAAVLDALKWLRDHQSQDGFWDCDEFMYEDKHEGPSSDGPGNPVNDVGVTGLALLAFQGNGHSRCHPLPGMQICMRTRHNFWQACNFDEQVCIS